MEWAKSLKAHRNSSVFKTHLKIISDVEKWVFGGRAFHRREEETRRPSSIPTNQTAPKPVGPGLALGQSRWCARIGRQAGGDSGTWLQSRQLTIFLESVAAAARAEHQKASLSASTEKKNVKEAELCIAGTDCSPA